MSIRSSRRICPTSPLVVPEFETVARSRPNGIIVLRNIRCPISDGGGHADEEIRNYRYDLVTLDPGGDGADAARRKGSPAGLQTRYQAVLQPSAARTRPGQGLHEGSHPRTVRALQRGNVPGVAEAVGPLLGIGHCRERGIEWSRNR